MNYTKLIKAADKAKENSYSPFSKFKVGAAILCEESKIITGCNIENSSYSLTICAERVAIFKAISLGFRHFKAIAIYSDSSKLTPPCGACRQVLLELAGDIKVILSNGSRKYKVYKLSKLLPNAFTSKNLSL